MVVERCNRQFGGETIHPTKKNYFNEFVANVLRDNIGILITSIEAVRGQTPYSDCTLWHCGIDQTLNQSAKVCGRCMVFVL